MLDKQFTQNEKNATSYPASSNGCYFSRLDILKNMYHYKINSIRMLQLLKSYNKGTTNCTSTVLITVVVFLTKTEAPASQRNDITLSFPSVRSPSYSCWLFPPGVKGSLFLERQGWEEPFKDSGKDFFFFFSLPKLPVKAWKGELWSFSALGQKWLMVSKTSCSDGKQQSFPGYLCAGQPANIPIPFHISW